MAAAPYRFLYNPRRSGTDELRQTFVGRDALWRQLLDHLRVHAQARSLQHLLLVGPRGAGKTHLVTMLAREVIQSNLAGSWRPIQLSEEEWGISTLRELIIAAFESLEREPVDNLRLLPEHLRPAAAIEALRNVPEDDAGAELGLALLNELARETGRRNLLVVENLDTLLDDDFDDDFGKRQLRSELMTGSNLLMIATSPGTISELENHDSPLFGLLRPIILEDLSLDELEELLRKRADFEAAADPQGPAARFLDRLNRQPDRARALLFLTGGNPRTALMLYQVVVQGDVDRLRLSLEALLDELTPYFQSRIKELPTQQRKIVNAVTRIGRALRPSEIAAAINMPSKQASSLIGRLVDRGFLRLAPHREGRGRYYVLREMLYRYWKQWHGSRQDFSLFVDFLAAWFLREELEKWIEQSRPAVPSAEPRAWQPLVIEALTVQADVCDRLSINHHTMTRVDDTSRGADRGGGQDQARDSSSTDPMLRRILAQYVLPDDSPGAQLHAAAASADFEAADRRAGELARALTEDRIPADQEIASLARLVAYSHGPESLAAAEAVRRRRTEQMEGRYLHAFALDWLLRHAEAIEAFEGLSRDSQHDEDPFEHACCLTRLGRLYHFESRLEEATAALNQAKKIFASLSESLGEANCLRSLGELQMRMDELDAARQSYEAALPLYRETRARLGEANCLRSLGELQMRMAELDAARQSYEAALPLYRETRSRLGEANCLRSLGELQMRMDELDAARQSYEAALPLYRETRDRLGEANCLRSLGELQMRMDELDAARQSYEAALPLYRETRARLGEANCLRSLGELQMRMDELDAARQSYEAALPLYRETRDRLGEANCLRSLAALRIAQGEAQPALNELRQSEQLSGAVDDALGLMANHIYEADARVALGQPAHAVAALEAGLDHARKAQDLHGRALSLRRQARALDACGQGRAALAALHLCRAAARQSGLDFEAEIESIFQQVGERSDENEFSRLMADLKTDAESIRAQGVRAAAPRAELERRLEQHSEEIERLEQILKIILRSDEANVEQLAQARGGLTDLLARDDVSDLVRAFLNGGFVALIRQERYDDVLAWVARVDDWSPEDFRGLFAPLAIAARHLRGEKEDARLLDQQAPEVRKAVEMIIEEASRATAKSAAKPDTQPPGKPANREGDGGGEV